MGRSHIRSRRDADPTGYGFDLEELARPLDREQLFGRGLAGGPAAAPAAAPLELEIGSGKGSFLIAEGEARPDTLFLGVERARRYWLYAADRLRRRERRNARIVLGEATGTLDALLPGSLAAIRVFFPDPWPKRRHAHRRLLLQPDFLAAAERALAPGGALYVVTDDADYFARVEEVLAARPRLARHPYEPPVSARQDLGELAGSNFERKYRLEGRRIQALAAVRSADEDDALAGEE